MEPKTKRKKKAKGITAKAKKKTAVARAVIRPGHGRIRVNKRLLDFIEPVHVRELIREPLEIGKNVASQVDIDITVHGSGFMSQAVAARSAIAKCLIAFSKDEKLKKDFLDYDRMLLVDDVRRKESKKQLGLGARRKKQKSKR